MESTILLIGIPEFLTALWSLGNFEMQIYNYNKEKKDNKRTDVYLKFGLFGAFVALMFIGGAKLLAWLLKFVVTHWIWVIVLLAAAFLIRHFFIKRRKK